MEEDYWANKKKEIARQNKIRNDKERIRNMKTPSEKSEIELCERMREIYAENSKNPKPIKIPKIVSKTEMIKTYMPVEEEPQKKSKLACNALRNLNR